jgi:hypothetical protein
MGMEPWIESLLQKATHPEKQAFWLKIKGPEFRPSP